MLAPFLIFYRAAIPLSLYIEAANFMPPVFFIKKLLEKTTAIEEMVSTSKQRVQQPEMRLALCIEQASVVVLACIVVQQWAISY